MLTMYHDGMTPTPFWNRRDELDRIRRRLGRGAFGYVTGRRRIGKTALLLEAAKRFGGVYHQAVEGTVQQQILHAAEELGDRLPILRDIVPKTWGEFFRLLSKERLPALLIFDELPYWIQGDPGFSSVLQKWVDHDLPKQKTLLLVSGSSQAMLHSQFLQQSSPLYGRAALHVHLSPLSYHWFCQALRYDPADPVSFARFSVVGGVPHYWKLLPARMEVLRQIQTLYFEPSSILAEEPIRLIRDEGVMGALPRAILDLVGRGVTKPSELAARLGTVHSNLSRPLALLLELGLIHRDLPFGESPRTSKKVLYSVQDPALLFYYGTCLMFRSRWEHLPRRARHALVSRHVGQVWEQFCRHTHPGSGRYWEKDVELDLVCPQTSAKRFLVAECKWKRLTPGKEHALLADLRARFSRTKLASTLRHVTFRILTPKDLPRLATRER